MEYASKAATPLAATALGLAIPGALSFLQNLTGTGNGSRDININAPDVEVARLRNCVNPWTATYGGGHYAPVNHHELGYVQQLAQKDAIIADQNARLVIGAEIDKVYKYVNQKFEDINNRFCYDEKLIEKNACRIEEVDNYGKCNYYKMDKVIRPWDICPPVQLATTPTVTTAVTGKVNVSKEN